QESAGNMSLRQIRVQFESAGAMEFSLLQPDAGRIEFEMPTRIDLGECPMGESERGIAHDRVGEVMARLFRQRRIACGAQAVAPHEFRICQRVPAVARLLGSRGALEWPL